MDRKKVLVISGKNEKTKGAMFRFLRKIGLHPFELKNRARRSSYPYEGIQAVFKDACAVLVLLTGDDEAKLRERYDPKKDSEDERLLYPQLRANVLFEAGMAFAQRPNNTILVKLGNLRLCSDLRGRSCIELNNTREKRCELITTLRSVGCIIDLSNNDWVDAGDFSEDLA